MNRVLRFVLLALLLTLAIGVFATSEAGAVPLGTIWGGVNGDGVGSLPGVEVLVYSASDYSLVATGAADASGLYSIPVDYGSYLVLYDAAAYNILNSTFFQSNWWQAKPTSATADPVVVSDIEPSVLVSVILAQYNRVTGRVTDVLSGSELASVTVTVRDDLGSVLATAITDANGDYVTPRIAAYQQWVWTQFTPSGYNAEHPNGPNYVGGWGGPNLERTGATAYLAPGAADAVVNAQLTPFTVVGTVSEMGSGPVQGAEVQLWNEGSLVATASTDAFGIYWLYPPQGSYKIYVDPTLHNTLYNRYPPLDPEWYSSKEDSASADTITLDEGVHSALADCSLGYRTVAVFFSGNSANGAEVRLCSPNGSVLSTTTVAGGKAVFSPVADGDYRLYLNMAPYNVAHGTSYLSGWYFGSYEPPSPSLSGASGFYVSGDFIYEAWFQVVESVHITGAITLEGSAPVPGVDVEVWDDTSIVASACTTADGAFDLQAIPGRDLRIHYDTRAYNASATTDIGGGWFGNPGLREYSQAARIFGTPGSVHDVSIALSPYWGVDGTVTSSLGDSVPEVLVVVRPRIKAGYPPELEWLQTLPSLETRTDAYGRYEIDLHNLISPMYAEWIESVMVAFHPGGTTYLREYYNDRTAEASSDPVPVAMGVPASADATLALAGRITGSVTGVEGPLTNTNVFAYDANGQIAGSGFVGETGDYSIEGLAAGTYRVNFDTQPYVDMYWQWNSVRLYYPVTWWNGRDDISVADPIEVRAGETTTGIDAFITEKIVAVAGTVRDESNAGVPGTSVIADRLETYWNPDAEAFFSYWSSFAQTTTGADGSYILPRIPEGEYRIQFCPQSETELVSEYYNDAHDISEADTLTVSADMDITGIDATLQPVGIVSGTVVDEVSGNPIQGVPVQVMRFFNGVWQVWSGTQTGLDGRYRLPVDVQDNVRVLFGSPWSETFSANGSWYATESWDDSATVETAHDFAMTYSAQFTADATLSPCGGISGHLTYDPEQAQVTIEALTLGEAGWQVASVAEQEVNTVFDPELWEFRDIPTGNYSFPGLKPGTYRIRFRTTWGPYATGYYHGVSEVEAAEDITVAAGDNRTGIDDSLTLGGSIWGQVGTLSGIPDGAYVALYRKSSFGWEFHYQLGVAGSSGDFRFTGLRAGRYTVVASMQGYVPEAWDNRIATGFSPAQPGDFTPPEGAETIEVQAGGAVTRLPSPILLQADNVLDLLPPVSTCLLPVGWTNQPVVPVVTAMDAVGSPTATYAGLGDGPLILRSVLPTVSAEGVTTVRYYSVDAAGNQEDTRTAQVRIDLSPPITADNAVPSYRSKAIVQFFPSDRLSGPYETHYVLDGGAEMIGTAAVTEAPGEHTLSYWSVDRAGNAETPNEIGFLIGDETVPPSTTASAPAGWAKAPVTVELTATDNASGVDAIYYSTDGTAPRYVYYRPLSISEHGLNVIKYNAVDLFGNAETPHDLELLVDARAPVTTHTVTQGTQEATVTLSATDQGAGLNETKWTLDGGLETSGTVVKINSPGEHTVRYRSADAVGNVEEWHEEKVYVAYTSTIRTTISATTVTYPAAITLTGRLYHSENTTVTGKTLFVDYSYNGVTWSRLTTATISADSYTFSTTPSRLTYYRLVLPPGSAGPLLTPTQSAASRVVVRASLTAPWTPSVVYRSRAFSIYSYVRPRHTSGITFYFDRYESGRWVNRSKVPASYATVNSTTTKAYRSTSLVYAGRWRVRAYHASDVHPAGSSGYRYFTVR